jgi:copper chaperone
MKTTLNIQNLKCGGCAITITKNLSSLEGIDNIAVNVEENAVSFSYSNENQLTAVKDKLKTLGYPEDGEANSLGSKAKSYVSCAIGKMS